MHGKLDWVLLRRLAVHAKAVGNHNYSASDHKWLSVDVSFTKDSMFSERVGPGTGDAGG